MTETWKTKMLEVLCDRNLDDEAREEAFLLKQQHLPLSLYKYGTVSVHTEALLTEGTVWLANPDEFNDPFDSASTFSFSELASKIRQDPRSEKESLLEKLIRGDTLSLPNFLRSSLIDELGSMGKKWSTTSSQALTALLRENLGVTCFTETPTNVPMWAHYANNHTGFCCEWHPKDCSDEILRRHIFPVIYSGKPLREPPLITNPHYPDAPNLLALTKSPDWAYEKEWRYVQWGEPICKGRPLKLPLPRTIHLGLKTSAEDESTLRRLCQQSGIEVKRVKADVEHSQLMVDDA